MNSYDIISMVSYDLITPNWWLDLGVNLHVFFFILFFKNRMFPYKYTLYKIATSYTFSHEIELTIPSHGYIHNIALPWVFASYKTTKNKTKMKNKQILRTYFLTKHYVIKVICGIRDEPILQFRLIRLNQ